MTRDSLNRSLKDSANLIRTQLIQLKKLKHQREEDNSTLTKLISDLSDNHFQNKRKEETCVTLSNQLERTYQAKLASHEITEEAIQEAERKDYREKLYCRICNRVEKDSVLNKCLHVFCGNCLEKICAKSNFSERKCPKCSILIAKGDWSKIYYWKRNFENVKRNIKVA